MALASPVLARASSPHDAASPAPVHRVVGLVECTFIDDSRGVLDFATTPATARSDHRTLLTEIRYPALSSAHSTQVRGAKPLRQRSGYPLIIFAHGYDVTPDVYAALLNRWVAAGFVVVAPFFPDEKPSTIAAEGGANTEGDLRNEPADLAFVTTRVLDASAGTTRSCVSLRGLVRSSQIVLAGHSDGADAVAMLAYDHGLDPEGVPFERLHAAINFRSVVILAGAEVPPDHYGAEPGQPALLVVQSLADSCNPFWQGVQLYRNVHQTNKAFLELTTAHHLPAFDGVDGRAFNDVATVTTKFLSISLKIPRSAPWSEQLGHPNPAVAHIYDTPLGPHLSGVPALAPSCGLH